jgi:TRAP-type C4-dicarboxylate transport system permease large subunit
MQSARKISCPAVSKAARDSVNSKAIELNEKRCKLYATRFSSWRPFDYDGDMERKRPAHWQLLLMPVPLLGILIFIGMRSGWQSVGEIVAIGTFAAIAIALWRAIGRW